MENESEVQDSLNAEGDQDTILENESSGDDLVKTKEYANNQKIRAEKAEKELKILKAQVGKTENVTPKNDEGTNKSNEPDYSKLAFLEGRKVDHPDDQKIVLDEAKRLNLPLTDILGMEHVKAKLKANSEQRDAEDGVPKGKGKAGGTTKGDVEYWLSKGGTPEDQDLAEKVVAARMKQESDRNMFSDVAIVE